jgi:hypothetical protein
VNDKFKVVAISHGHILRVLHGSLRLSITLTCKFKSSTVLECSIENYLEMYCKFSKSCIPMHHMLCFVIKYSLNSGCYC